MAEAADEAATAASVQATIDAFGGVDVLLANAGTEGNIAPIEAMSMSDFEHVIRTNVTGVWLSMKHCIEPMKKRGGGSIIAISSIAGMIGFPAMAPYIASKHAVFGLVKTAALELGEFAVRVNAIGPGPIENRMMEYLGLLVELLFFALGLYVYLLVRGFIRPKTEEKRKAIDAFRKKNGWWLRVLSLALMAVMGLNIFLHIASLLA